MTFEKLHENPSQLHPGAEENRAYYVPAATRDEALSGQSSRRLFCRATGFSGILKALTKHFPKMVHSYKSKRILMKFRYLPVGKHWAMTATSTPISATRSPLIRPMCRKRIPAGCICARLP